jgi:hypothetical protein
MELKIKIIILGEIKKLRRILLKCFNINYNNISNKFNIKNHKPIEMGVNSNINIAL